MGATITTSSAPVASTSPELVLSYESTRRSGNKVHQLLGGDVAVTFGPAGLRTGRLELFYPDEADAEAAELMHTLSAVFTLTYPERPTLAMSYVVADAGTITRTLDPDTRDRWIVAVDFQEVAG